MKRGGTSMSSANLERLCESFDYDSDEYDYDDFGAYMRKAYDGYDDYDKSDYEDYLSDIAYSLGAVSHL
jgi:hypothetical protein